MLAFQMPPLYLGPYGTIAVTIVIIALAFMNYKRGTWKSTADAAVVEMKVHKEACERLREEKKEADVERVQLAADVIRLQAATDLKPLIEMVGNWIIEGRTRFTQAEKRLDQIHAENTIALTAVLEEVKAQRTTSEDAYRSLTNTFIAHTLETDEARVESKQVNFRFMTMMDSLERRLTEVAVRVGHVRWQDKPAES